MEVMSEAVEGTCVFDGLSAVFPLSSFLLPLPPAKTFGLAIRHHRHSAGVVTIQILIGEYHRQDFDAIVSSLDYY